MVGHFRDISAESTGIGDLIGSLAVWIFNCIVSFTFFKIIDFFLYQVPKLLLDKRLLRIRQVHFLYGFIAVLGLVWGIILAGDKGLSLEEIEQKWRKIENVEGINH